MNIERRVGIVIPTYNDGLFVLEAADSAAAALGTSENIVIVNDGSTRTESRRALATLQRNGFTVVHQPNRGVSVARNTGLATLATPYAITLDADDMIHPNAPTIAADALAADDTIAISTGAMIEFDAQGAMQKHLPRQDATRIEMRHETKIHICSAFRVADWRRTDGFPPGVRYGEDWVFWMRLLKLRPQIHRSPSPYIFRRRHDAQATTGYINPIESAKARILVMQENPDLVVGHIDEFIEDFDLTLTTLSAYRRAYRHIDALKQRLRRTLDRQWLRRSS